MGHIGKDFNPRSREGSDQQQAGLIRAMMISIHAPVKGATWCGRERGTQKPYFNPRSREGSDDNTRVELQQILTFQSTLP